MASLWLVTFVLEKSVVSALEYNFAQSSEKIRRL